MDTMSRPGDSSALEHFQSYGKATKHFNEILRNEATDANKSFVYLYFSKSNFPQRLQVSEHNSLSLSSDQQVALTLYLTGCIRLT